MTAQGMLLPTGSRMGSQTWIGVCWGSRPTVKRDLDQARSVPVGGGGRKFVPTTCWYPGSEFGMFRRFQTPPVLGFLPSPGSSDHGLPIATRCDETKGLECRGCRGSTQGRGGSTQRCGGSTSGVGVVVPRIVVGGGINFMLNGTPSYSAET